MLEPLIAMDAMDARELWLVVHSVLGVPLKGVLKRILGVERFAGFQLPWGLA
jgi:hypothetical protein